MDFYHCSEPPGIQKPLCTLSVAMRSTLIFVTAFLSREFLFQIRSAHAWHGFRTRSSRTTQPMGKLQFGNHQWWRRAFSSRQDRRRRQIPRSYHKTEVRLNPTWRMIRTLSRFRGFSIVKSNLLVRSTTTVWNFNWGRRGLNSDRNEMDNLKVGQKVFFTTLSESSRSF